MQNYTIPRNNKEENIGDLWFVDNLDKPQKYNA